MSLDLDRLVAGARSQDVAWDDARASRVLAGALRVKESRARRDRALRRGLVVASGAAFVVMLFIRSASSHEAEVSTDAPPANQLAVRDGDGGYARD
ncbi:MAG TPA: hypothetical protein VIF62_17045 [Labilithrix sp.]|jgi:hypothetical protein